MEAVQKKGLTKTIGLSNFNKAQITRVLENSTVKPAVLQVEHLLCYLFIYLLIFLVDRVPSLLKPKKVD